MTTILDEVDQECLRCRVPNECNSRHELCGINRGIKYGHYKKGSASRPDRNISKLIQNTCGVRQQPETSGELKQIAAAITKLHDSMFYMRRVGEFVPYHIGERK